MNAGFWIVLSPKHPRFTTKGINLSLKKPVGFVRSDLPEEFLEFVYQAIADEKIFRIDNPKFENFEIENQGKLGECEDVDIPEKAGKWIDTYDEDGRPVRAMQFPDEDGNIDPEKPARSIILTGVTWEELDDKE